jgi:membrane-bound metal-dependent hydrolase YbcI (DUF457 family)
MDNLTHSLFGATLARTPLGRAGRGTTAALILSSNAPDVDVVTVVGGALNYLEWHRGPTHAPLGVVGLGLLTAGLVWSGLRVFDRSRAGEHAPFRMLAAISMIGVLLHVALDFPTSYGTRLLSPFDWHWYASDLMPIVDIYLLIALAAGLLLGQRWPASRRQIAFLVLTVMMANYGLRAVSHQRALGLAPRAFGPLLPEPCVPGSAAGPLAGLAGRWPRGPVEDRRERRHQSATRCLVEIAAIPTFVSPFRWQLIAHLSNAYETQAVDILDPRFRTPPAPDEVMWRLTRRVPNQWTPAALQAAETVTARTFLGFSRFPATRSLVEPDGSTVVRWTDMRFELPVAAGPRANEAGGRGGLFTARVRVDRTGKIVEETYPQ